MREREPLHFDKSPKTTSQNGDSDSHLVADPELNSDNLGDTESNSNEPGETRDNAGVDANIARDSKDNSNESADNCSQFREPGKFRIEDPTQQ